MSTQEVTETEIFILTSRASQRLKQLDEVEFGLKKVLERLVHQRVRLQRHSHTRQYGEVFYCIEGVGKWRSPRRGELSGANEYSFDDESYPSFEAVIMRAWIEHQPSSVVRAYIAFIHPGDKAEYRCDASKVSIEVIPPDDSA